LFPDAESLHVAEYTLEIVDTPFREPAVKVRSVNVVPATQPASQGTFRIPWYDPFFPRDVLEYDKKGSKIVVAAMKKDLLGQRTCRMSRRRASKFLRTESNFVPLKEARRRWTLLHPGNPMPDCYAG